MPNHIQPFSVPIVRVTDRAYHEAVGRVAAALADRPETAKFTSLIRKNVHNNNQEITFEIQKPFHEPGTTDEHLKGYLELEGYFIRILLYEFPGKMTFSVTRNLDPNNGQFNRPCDVINITFHHEDEKRAIATIRAIREHFKCWDEQHLPDALGEDVKNYYAVRENNAHRLEDKLGELTSKLADFAIQNERDVLKKKETLEDVHRQRIAELEEERKKLLAEVAEREKLLDDRAAKINDRENVHERRRLYDEIKKQIQSKSTKPELTKHTQELRKMVWWLSAGVAGFLFIVFVICFSINLASEKVNWVSIGSQIASGATLIGVATFVIRWQNRWFTDHANEEFRLKRMELDIERASWLVELALEWFAETQNPIPQELLDKLSTSLFTEGAGVPLDMSPLEALRTGLLGKNWKVSLEPTKVEAESGRAKK